jgi:hypothetical protein
MKTIKTGQYPEFYCDTSTVIPKCTVKWSDTYADVPEPFPQEQHIKLDLPEFTFGDVQIIMGIPEFSMERQRWVIGLPQFKLKNVSVTATSSDNTFDTERLQSAQSLGSKLSEAKSQQLRDTVAAAHSFYQCLRTDFDTQVASVSAQYSVSVSQLSAVINTLSDRGVNASDVKNADGTFSDLIGRRTQLLNARDQALTTFANVKQSLDTSERDLVSKLK